MSHPFGKPSWALSFATVLALSGGAFCQVPQPPASQPAKVYVPYEKLKSVFETERQGVFMPYEEFQRLWRAAQVEPARVIEAPTPYLISTARLAGSVDAELATLKLELTVDILAEGWVQVPIGLGDVAVADAKFAEAAAQPVRPAPLLRVIDGQYFLLTKGRGRVTLQVDFVRQLVTQPGLNVLGFRIPSSAITTLELTIPEENMKVDVEPMLAASTEQADVAGKKATRLRAFLGASPAVKLSWKPKTQAAEELAAVVISEQTETIHVAEALISHEVRFSYDIRRRGVESFTIQLPAAFRVTTVEGDNISKWDIAAAGAAQNLTVNLFSAAKGSYALTVKMELFLKDPQVKVALTPILTQQVLRGTGTILITHTPRRSVEVTGPKNLARVPLPPAHANQAGATAWRFITADYGAALDIGTVEPRIAARHLWTVGVDSDRLELRGRLEYAIERTGVFQLSFNLPEPWLIVSLGPPDLVDDHQLSGKGRDRMVNILLKREVTGQIALELSAKADRPAADAPVDLALPLADERNLRLYSGQVVLLLADRLRAEVETLQQLQSLPLARAAGAAGIPSLSPAMAFEFRTIDRKSPAGAKLKIAVKPTQISAVVNRLVSIQPGSVEEHALVDYRVLYAPVDTLYLKMPAALADAGARIEGPDIKEKPRIDELPADQRGEGPATAPGAEAVKWAYFKIALQAPVIGRYRLAVTVRRSLQASSPGKVTTVAVEPILAAGKLSDQTGFIAVGKADTLAIGEPIAKNLTPGDPTSEADVPEPSFRQQAVLAFRYNAPPFELSLPVSVQKEAAVFTTIATGAVIEQVLGRDGQLNTHAIYLLATSRGDRLTITLPPGAEKGLFAVLLNGGEAPTEPGAKANQKIVRLPPSAGQVSKLVLELKYGLKESGPPKLIAPRLPDDIPVQQTLWRLRMPPELRLLWFDNAFSRLEFGANAQLQSLRAGYPTPIQFPPHTQDEAHDFIRQGPPGELGVLVMDRETFSIAIWAAILVVGVAALKLRWFGRCVLVLLAALAAIVVRLFAPFMVREVVYAGYWAGTIVLGLWVAHWLFRWLPQRFGPKAGPPTPQAAGPATPPSSNAAPPSGNQTRPQAPPSRPQEPSANQGGNKE